MRAAWIAAVMLYSTPAAADHAFIESGSDWALVVPQSCNRFAPQKPENSVYWGRWLSLAACMQPTGLREVSEIEELYPMVREQMLALAPAMLLYKDALDRGPRKIQLRTAYHLALASIALITRAHDSIRILDEDGRQFERERVLHARVEPLLAPAKQMARLALSSMLEEAAKDPTLADDPVGRHMVRSAGVLLGTMMEVEELAPVEIMAGQR